MNQSELLDLIEGTEFYSDLTDMFPFDMLTQDQLKTLHEKQFQQLHDSKDGLLAELELKKWGDAPFWIRDIDHCVQNMLLIEDHLAKFN